MRGASALGDLLEEKRRDDLRTFVVWLPILEGDTDAPSAITAGAVPDRHVRKAWDPERRIGIEAARSLPRTAKRPCRMPTGREEPEAVSWDCVLVFEPGARWEETLPAPAWFAGPVIDVIDGARRAIDAPLSPASPSPSISP